MTHRYGFLAGLDFVHQPASQVLHSLAEIGYQAVSWPLSRYDPLTTGHAERQELVRQTHTAGLAISEWVLQLDYITLDASLHRERIDHSVMAIRSLSEADSTAPINLFTGPAPWDPTAPRLGVDLTEGEAWDRVKQAFDVLVPLAEKEGVCLAVEGVFGHLVHDYYTAQELLRLYPSPSLGVNFDPSHGTLYGNDIPWAIRQLGGKIFHVHLKDAVGRPGGLPGETFLFPLLGEGEVPWPAFFAALDSIHYTGYLTVEFESFAYYKNVLQNDAIAAARLSMELLNRIEHPSKSS
jgi:sugar phosphate isomerase/epimerase